MDKVGIKPPLPDTRRKVLKTTEPIVRSHTHLPERVLPLIVEPAWPGIDLVEWLSTNRGWLDERLLEHGAMLCRGFALHSLAQFEAFVNVASGSPIEYRERTSPRTAVGNKVYTSTDYPPQRSIFPHNEHSYSNVFPLRLYFFCDVPAEEGGETPLVDTRRVLQRIAPTIYRRFVERKWMFVRNFGDGFGLSWQTAFQTNDRAEVERYCREHRIECLWKDGGGLQTKQIRDAVAKHPRTGELMWFNHATFFHYLTLEPDLREGLLSQFAVADLPNNTYYGDGAPIEAEVIDELQRAYLDEQVIIPWRSGDLVILDNMRTAHGRMPYRGPRRILFAMSDPVKRDVSRTMR